MFLKKGLKIMSIGLAALLLIVLLLVLASYINHKVQLAKEEPLFIPIGQQVEVGESKINVYSEGNGEQTLLAIATPVMNKLAQIPFFSPPDFFPAEINPNKTSIPGYMMEYKLSGQYWVIAVYFVGWFFNIFGEEFLWRGIIFPRQIKRYGSRAWIIHGIMWGLWHFFWKWQLIVLIPVALFLSYAVYKRKNIWIGIIAHGAINLIPLIMIIIAVFK